MRIVRPKHGISTVQRPSWRSAFGFASDQDGRATELLSLEIRAIGNDWLAVLLWRLLLLATLADFGGLGASLAAQIGLGVWLAGDAMLVGAHRIGAYRRRAPNLRLALTAGLVGLSGLAHSACASLLLAQDPVAALAAILGPALVALVVLGRMRLPALLLACGAGLGQLVFMPDKLAAVPFLGLVASIAMLLGSEHWSSIRSVARGHGGKGSLTGEQAKALLQEFEKSGHGWFWETDRNGNIAYISETLAAKLGREPHDLIGTAFSSLIATSRTGTDGENQRTLGFHFSARTAFSNIAVRAAFEGEEERWWSISGQPVVTSFGQFLGFRGNGSDLTEMRRSQAEVARLASVDSLTGLANRPQMMADLEQTLNPKRGLTGECALFLLDLDRFKEVNDTMGHPAGDALLRQVAHRLQRIVGAKGKVGRLGGDEFKVILPGKVETIELAKLADAIIHSLSEPYSIDGSQVVIGVSIGISVAPTDGANSETLIRNADLALYTAKGEGRGQFRFFMPAMHAEAEDRRQLEGELRQAIATGGLHLEYQPVVCAASERITGFESLVRWTHPVRGPISPALFVPIAEDAGLIGALGEWVMRTACSDAVKWPKGTRVAVNVSPIQFANAGLPNVVLSALVNSNLSPERLELEITESVFLADQSNTDSMFAQLKKLGVRLALDDFGTGYSALGYLKTAPFDKIKIDQSFVRGAAIKGSRNAAIVKSIVNLAEALGMETTAEGAETLDELDLIRSLGCSHVQGYVYGRPAKLPEAVALMAQHGGHAVASGHKSSREPRRTMLRTVALFNGTNRYTARVRNISSSGALIEGVSDVPPGTTFVVEFSPNFRVSGTCRWSDGPRMGFEFDRAVEIHRLRDGHRAASAVSAEAQPSADEKRLAG